MAVFNVKNNQVWPDQYPKQSFLWFSLAPLKLPSLWANAKFALALQKVKKHHNSICKFHFYTHCSSSTMRGSSFARLSFLRPPLFVHSASPFYYFFSQTCHNVGKIFFGITSKFAQFVLIFYWIIKDWTHIFREHQSTSLACLCGWWCNYQAKFLNFTSGNHHSFQKWCPHIIPQICLLTLDVLYNRWIRQRCCQSKEIWHNFWWQHRHIVQESLRRIPPLHASDF